MERNTEMLEKQKADLRKEIRGQLRLLPEEEKEQFCTTLDKLYWRSKNERRAGFVNISEVVNLKNAADEKEYQ